MIKIRKTLIVGIASLLGAVSLSACELPVTATSSLSSDTTSALDSSSADSSVVPSSVTSSSESSTTSQPVVTLVDIAATNNKASYEIGDSLDITVKAHYSDGTYVDVTNYQVSGFFNENPGDQTVKITYEGKETTVNVHVNPRPVVLEGITVIDNKANSGYEIDDELDIKVTANYSDGSTVELEEYTVTTFDNQNAGTQELVVTYQDKTATVTVTVNPKPIVLTSISVKDNQEENGYEIGDELDITVTATYSDGHTEEVEAGAYSVVGYDNFTSGEQDLTVSYEGQSTVVKVTVNPAQLVRIEVVDNKAESGYEIDDELDITVTAYYTDNSAVTLNNYEVTGYDSSVTGSQEVTVTFEDITKSITILVKENTFPVKPFNDFVAKKDVWVDVPLPYATGEWVNGTIQDSNYGTGFHAQTADTSKTYMDFKYADILKENDWNVEKTPSNYKARKGNAIIVFRTSRRVFYFDLFTTGEPRPVYPTAIALSGPETIVKGKSTKVNLTYTPANTNKYVYKWESSNESVATVDENGLVKALDFGFATITAYAKNANQEDIFATYTFEVVEQTGDEWTIMLYISGTNLESDSACATDDIQEVLNVNGQPDDVNILFETGGSTYWHNPQIDRNKLCRFHADNHQLVLDEKIAQGNMGNASTLSSYINWGIENYPADKYGLILWNHGGALDGCCSDYNYGGDSLLDSEVASALDNVFATNELTDKLEFIGYDCCLMQVQDIAEVNSKYFNYMIASEETENGDGWDYEGWVDDLYAHKSTTQILTACCETFVSQYGSYNNDQTLSVLDLSKMANYYNKFEAMAAAIKNTAKNNLSSFKSLLKTAYCFYDVDSFGLIDAHGALTKIAANSLYSQYADVINEAKTALGQLVVYSATGRDAAKAKGLALFAPVGSSWWGTIDYPESETHFNTWRSIFK